jgi:hypothetical protein
MTGENGIKAAWQSPLDLGNHASDQSGRLLLCRKRVGVYGLSQQAADFKKSQGV